MTPRDRAAVNRANSRASTGPKSPAGKAKVARNALRHGLAAVRLAGPQRESEAATLARAIAGPRAGVERFAAALVIAQAQTDLQRVRRVRVELLDRAWRETEQMRERTLTSPENATAEFSRILRELVALGRYESRSVTRRKLAIREFDAVKTKTLFQRSRRWQA